MIEFWTLRRLICVLRWHADKRPHSRWCGYGVRGREAES